MLEVLNKIYKGREVLINIKEIFEIKKIKTEEEFNVYFEKFNQKYDTTFKFYFLNLYQILKYIDGQKSNIEDAKEYTNIVRAQLSKDELVLLFYNAIGVIPFSGENYKKLVEKYALFEHLTYDDFTPAKNKVIGFKQTGFNTIWANEYDKEIWETFEKNFKETTLRQKKHWESSIR